jgi:polysaccharide chain length determinant protein (PEP-CTERM system associated)
MLPGKKYTPEDVVRILLRRSWIIVITLALGATAAALVSKRLPNQYRSETLIMLIPQRIPDTIVKGAIKATIEDRLNSLQDQILSRSRLERIIDDLKLYPSLRRTLPMEDVVQRMRDNDIVVRTEGKQSFRVTYVSRDAVTAQKTTERLASLFIDESIRESENVAEDTNQFLEAQLEDAKRRLLDHEKKLEEYRTRYGSELPTQAPSNLQAIQNAQVQLQSLSEAADRARERRNLLERQLADLEAELTPAPTPPSAPNAPETVTVESTAQQLLRAQAGLDALLAGGRKPGHPDVVRAQRAVRELQAKVDAERSTRPSDSTSAEALKGLSPAERQRQQKIRDLKAQIADIDRQLAEKQEQERRLRAVVTEYQNRLEAVPKRESELTELQRDYATLQAAYNSLLAKREDAKLAANLGRRNIGEQFKVLDAAKVPERPFSPNRLLIHLGGAGGGFALGILLIALLEYRDSSLRSEDDVVRVLNMRVLALVPLMVSEAERTAKRRFAFVGAALVVLIASGAAFAVWSLRL